MSTYWGSKNKVNAFLDQIHWSWTWPKFGDSFGVAARPGGWWRMGQVMNALIYIIWILDLFKSHGKKELIYSPDNSISGIQNNEIILSSSWECSDFTRALGPTAKQEMTTLSLCIYSTVWVWALERKPPGACLYGHCEDCFFFLVVLHDLKRVYPAKWKQVEGLA